MIRYCALGCLSLLLVGCSTAGFDRFGSNNAASLPPPAPTTPVQSQGLSPLVLDNQFRTQPLSGQLSQTNQPINNAMGAEAELVQGAQKPMTIATPSSARALARTDLLGAWTLASGAEQCKLNINLTNWTGGYRASTRGCVSPDLQRVNAWRLDGKQVVLLAEDGTTTLARLFFQRPPPHDLMVRPIKTDERFRFSGEL